MWNVINNYWWELSSPNRKCPWKGGESLSLNLLVENITRITRMNKFLHVIISMFSLRFLHRSSRETKRITCNFEWFVRRYCCSWIFSFVINMVISWSHAKWTQTQHLQPTNTTNINKTIELHIFLFILFVCCWTEESVCVVPVIVTDINLFSAW